MAQALMNEPLDNFGNIFQDGNTWSLLLENNPKRFLVLLLGCLCFLQSIELAKSFIMSTWDKTTSSNLRLKLMASTSVTYITLILIIFVWFQYQLKDFKGANEYNGEISFTSISEILISFIGSMLTLLAQFISLEPHALLSSQNAKTQQGNGQKTTIYTHYLLVMLINVLSAMTVFIFMTDFYTNVLQLLYNM